MADTASRVRDIAATDRKAFLEMWADFASLAPDEPGDPEMGTRNWDRVIDPRCPLSCLVVDGDSEPQGFALYLAFPFTWSAGEACYLEDLYVRPEARGRGLARAMIERLGEIGREKGWFKVFWMTQSDNRTAQRLYDRMAARSDHIRYDMFVRKD